MKKQHGLQAKFADEWGVSVKEATAWYTCKPGRRLKRPASKHAVDDSWKHDVVEDGDVHPHPGPSWRVVSLNVGYGEVDKNLLYEHEIYSSIHPSCTIVR